MRIDSRGVGIVRRRRAYRLGVTAVALEVATFLAAPLVPEALQVGFGLALLAVPILSVVAMLATRNVEHSPGFLELEEGALRVSRLGEQRLFSRQDVDGALVRDLRWLEVRLRSGDVISVDLEDPARGHELVRHLEKSGATRLAIRASAPHLSWAPLVAPAGLAISIGSLFAMFLFSRLGVLNPLTRLVALAVAVITTWVALHLRATTALTLGLDGLTIARAFSARFIPWSAVARTELVDGRLHLRLRDDRLVQLSSDPKAPMRTGTLIDRALSRSRGGASDGSSAALERDGRSLEKWRDEVVALTDESGDAAYRGVHLPRALLEEVLDDPRAAAERRIGAALALRALDPEYATRVRLAAESSANEHLRIALEKIADDDADLDTVEDATRAEQA